MAQGLCVMLIHIGGSAKDTDVGFCGIATSSYPLAIPVDTSDQSVGLVWSRVAPHPTSGLGAVHATGVLKIGSHGKSVFVSYGTSSVSISSEWEQQMSLPGLSGCTMLLWKQTDGFGKGHMAGSPNLYLLVAQFTLKETIAQVIGVNRRLESAFRIVYDTLVWCLVDMGGDYHQLEMDMRDGHPALNLKATTVKALQKEATHIGIVPYQDLPLQYYTFHNAAATIITYTVKGAMAYQHVECPNSTPIIDLVTVLFN